MTTLKRKIVRAIIMKDLMTDFIHREGLDEEWKRFKKTNYKETHE